jgi:hypothetical protein
MATATMDWIANYPSTLTKGPSSRLRGFTSFSAAGIMEPLPDEEYGAFASDVCSLLDEDLEDEPAIAEKVIAEVLDVAFRAWEFQTQSWVSPRVATDGNGGVRLNWRFNERELRAVIPQGEDRPRYLYWEEGTNFDTVENFTPASLWYWMNWLQGRDARAK